MKVYNVQVNHLTAPVGIDGSNLRVTWNLEGGIRQSAFCVKVGDTSGRITESSGKTESSQMHYMLQQEIPDRSEVIITVFVWDENGAEGESAQIRVVTGIAKEQWQAVWINPELTCDPGLQKPGSYLKKTFWVEKPGRVMLYITSHGIFNAYLNGQEITDYQLMPGTTQETKRLMVETLDVSDYVTAGENTLVVTLGDGWHRGAMGHQQERNVYGTDVALLCQMENDGEIVLVSDETWQAANDGPLGKNDLIAGEEYDARKEQSLSWHGVKKESFGYENLIYTDTLPILPHETFKAKLIITPKGEKVLDFGQNLVGYVRMEFEAKHGQKLTLVHGETLDGDGNFTIDNFQNPQVLVKQEIIYICKQGHNKYHPTKTYFGFRYVKVEADFPIEEAAFTAVAIYSDMRTTASFQCGVPEVNRLFENALWSMKGNFVDVPTDCPTREKSGYSGDCQTFVHTAMYLMDCYAVYAKWIREQAATQNKKGCVAQVAPMCFKKQNIADGGIGWCDSFEIIPFYLQKRYGDDALTTEYYEQIKKWMDYQIKKSNNPRPANLLKVPKKYRKYVLDNGWIWGEWLEPGRDGIRMDQMMLHGDLEVSSAYLSYGCAIVAELAKCCGKVEDEAYYREISEKAKEAYRYLFLKNGKIEEPERQCCYVRPIALNLLDEKEKAETAKTLVEKIKENGGKLNTGFLTTHELCRSLTRYGQKKTAYDLLLQREAPGWLYSVLHGATSIPENWEAIGEDGSVKGSFNHYSYGAIAGWLMDCVGGIRVEDGNIMIRPYPDERLGFVETVYESPYGKIVSSWRYENGGVSYHVEIPANVTATLHIEGETRLVESGVYDIACKQAFNPYLPLNQYVPDGEPHVFGDRVYVYGSHDQEGGEGFCLLDYEVFSAPVDDLGNWQSEGISYRKDQDPDCSEKYREMYAPDVVRGNDGRYYLYYAMAGGCFTGPIHVAVSDSPAGPFTYHGCVRNVDGSTFTKYITFDPGVLNDDGVIRLYYGWSLAVDPQKIPVQMNEGFSEQLLNVQMMMFEKTKEELLGTPEGIMGANVVELEDDMLTVKGEPKRIVPGQFDAEGTSFEGHAFFEASSIRKIGDTYYFIYSSQWQHELCYATSKYPDRDFVYRGVIISNGDIGYQGRAAKDRLAMTGNNHGSIECINGQWYVFYHRQTHRNSFNRQGCAERIEILSDGSISQVEMTSCGLNNGPLKAQGIYPAVIACNLTNGAMPHIGQKDEEGFPYITHEGEERFIADITDGTTIGYKYFDFDREVTLKLTIRGEGEGRFDIYVGEEKAGEIPVCGNVADASAGWVTVSTQIPAAGVEALYLKYAGTGSVQLKEVGF